MHCIEIKSKDLKTFQSRVGILGAKVEIVSRYTDNGIRLVDIEVSKDNKAINRVERQFAFAG